MLFEVLEAAITHSPILAQMNYQLIKDEKHRNSMNVSQLEQRMTGWLKSEYKAYCFSMDEEVVGYCLFRRDEDVIYIRQFYVDRAFRRQGVGEKVFKWLKRNVWKKSAKLRLDVLINNKRAINFWKAVGFKEYCITMEL